MRFNTSVMCPVIQHIRARPWRMSSSTEGLQHLNGEYLTAPQLETNKSVGTGVGSASGRAHHITGGYEHMPELAP